MLKKILSLYSRLYHHMMLYIPPPRRGCIEWVRLLCITYPKHIYYPYCCQIKRHAKKSISILKNQNVRYLSFFLSEGEGIGAQMCRYVTALILSHKFNLKFVYRPFKITVNTPQCNWEEFLGFGEGELKYENVINDKSIKIINLPHVDMRHSRWLQLSLLNTIINRIYPNDKILFLQTPHSFFPVDDTPLSKPIFSMLQNKYWRNREKYPVENHFDEKKLKVAVHVRRGEITHLKKIKHPQGLCRWVDNAWYIAVLKKINQLFTEQHVDIHVYSDAYNKDELDEFEELSNTTIHLKKDDIRQPFQAFHAMVIADIGVCGITGFSSSSGMLSKGIKIVPPSAVREVYFPTGPQWIFSDKKGNFDINVLLKKYPEFL